MRFISKYRGFSFVARPTRTGVDGWGQPHTIQEPIVCDFRHGPLFPWEIEAALLHFAFAAPGHDENVTYRLSVYDTDVAGEAGGWDEETKAHVEKRLLSKVGLDFIAVERPPLPTPWPTYDQSPSVESIVEMVVNAGFDPGTVLAYERENGNRRGVVEALEQLVPVQKDEQPAPAEEITA